MFFFSPDEADDFRREKRRRLIERTREDRVKARMLEDEEDAEEDVWDGSDEEPGEGQKELFTHTAKQLLACSNPAQLEVVPGSSSSIRRGSSRKNSRRSRGLGWVCRLAIVAMTVMTAMRVNQRR